MPARPIDYTKIPESSMTPEELKEYRRHLDAQLERIKKFERPKPISTHPDFVVPRSVTKLEGIPWVFKQANTVMTFDLQVCPNLNYLSRVCQDIIPGKYSPKHFAAQRFAVFRPGSKKAMCLGFRNGMSVLTGVSSEIEGLNYISNFVMTLRRAGVYAHVGHVQVENIVSASKGPPIDIQKILQIVGSRGTYEEDAIQCCFIKSANPESNVRLLVFPKGGQVYTGPDNHRDSVDAFYNSYQLTLQAIATPDSGHRESLKTKQVKAASDIQNLVSINNDVEDLIASKKLATSAGRRMTNAEKQDFFEETQKASVRKDQSLTYHLIREKQKALAFETQRVDSYPLLSDAANKLFLTAEASTPSTPASPRVVYSENNESDEIMYNFDFEKDE